MTQTDNSAWTPDESQRRVIEAPSGGYHLVLAPPGCGKTQILTLRIQRAHEQGVAYADMLCLTFTNRAARGMRERIAQYIDDVDLGQLYVGNIHRFCSKFLFENHLVEAETSVIDDDDALSILARYQNEEESEIKRVYKRRREYAEIIYFAHFMHQIIHGHPRELRLHPDCVSADDVRVMKTICKIEQRPFTPQAMIDIYDHTDYYRDAVKGDDYDVGTQALATNLLRKMRYAHAYTAYCRQNKLVDFEDLLLLTYDALCTDAPYHRYSWIQIDEVQDLNAMQMAIVDLVTHPRVASGDGMVMYLGDAQQAIFSFMGAKSDTLSLIRRRCGEHIYHLNINHRSPKALLEMTNTYAAQVLGVDPALLPVAHDDGSINTEMTLLEAPLIDSEYHAVATMARQLTDAAPGETTAIIVSSNYDADKIGDTLQQMDVPFFQVSGSDVFSSTEVKTMLAHLNVLASETNFMAWARLLYGLGVFAAPASAREFMRKMLNRAILPSDFLLYGAERTYVQDFVEAIDGNEPVVVFDTETTGLSVYDDDILQIAAVKLQQGRVVEGSEFVVHIQTSRPIPAMLGDTPNPIIAQREHAQLLPNAEALQLFLQYIGGCRLVGHNVEYDYQILCHNLQRYLPTAELPQHRRCLDTLKLLRLLHPELPSYRLDHFRAQHLFGLSEDNAHLADVDVEDTCKVVTHLCNTCREIIPTQREYLSRSNVVRAADVLRRQYRQLYLKAWAELYLRPTEPQKEPAMVAQMRALYDSCHDAGYNPALEHKVDYVLRYIAHDVVDTTLTPSLAEQLQRHLMEVNTLKEADLCGSGILTERIFVSTVHKAKGLEFDTVIIFDVVDGRYPGYFGREDPQQCAEDQRKLYVALTRARRRVCVAWSSGRTGYHGDHQPQYLSPFMKPIVRFFSQK